jgi:hypothetical protein
MLLTYGRQQRAAPEIVPGLSSIYRSRQRPRPTGRLARASTSLFKFNPDRLVPTLCFGPFSAGMILLAGSRRFSRSALADWPPLHANGRG